MRQPIERAYADLAAYLTAQADAGVRHITVTFGTVLATILRRPLPATARAGAEWSRATGHAPQAWYGWLRAG